MRRHFRLPRFALWVKVLSLWLVICLLGTEWNWQILATTCDGEMQLPIDDTKRVTRFSYDLDGRLTQACSPEGTVNYEYDPARAARAIGVRSKHSIALQNPSVIIRRKSHRSILTAIERSQHGQIDLMSGFFGIFQDRGFFAAESRVES